MKGAYALLINLEPKADICVGSLGTIHFPKGHYLYIGSAMNGIKGRVERHLRDEKKLHWHIDYFLKKAKIVRVYMLESPTKIECSIVKKMDGKFKVVKQFGSSDSNCSGHLFYGDRQKLEKHVLANGMKEFGM